MKIIFYFLDKANRSIGFAHKKGDIILNETIRHFNDADYLG